MRFTITKKVVISLMILLVIGTASMLIIYNGLNKVKMSIIELTDEKEPVLTAANEMEINMNGIAVVVLRYLNTTNPRYRQRMKKDEEDYRQFQDQYFQLIRDQKLREWGFIVDLLYRDFLILGREMMDKKDKQESIFLTVAENFEYMDEIIDQKIQPFIEIEGFDSFTKAIKSLDVEADIAEIGIWLANYQRLREDEYKKLIFENETELRESLRMFKALNVTAEENYWIEAVEGTFDQTMVLIKEILGLEDYLEAVGNQFIALRAEMDDILDDEIQLALRQDLSAPRKEADRATAMVLSLLQFSIPLFIVSALVVGLLLIRVIITPVRRLMQGTEAISRGDLRYRLAPRGDDEFADLAHQFNQMVAQLQATTVSRDLLEASEAKLQQTVADLRREVVERRRAQEEQARLQTSLRRSETMAAMGSLLAGVAHEVRNPLFGMSSTLDAFEARFGAQQEYQRYLHVLRGELSRLTELMRELLEYGRPSNLELSPGRIEEVIAAAVRACASLAGRLNVEIANHVQEGFPPVLMDQRRLLQVFQNLLENAIQHSPPGGTVIVEAGEIRTDEKAWIACTIEDDGPGFRTEDLPRIFEPFFTRRRGGTGFGLSIVQRIVEEHRGSIAASNRPAGGAMMIVRLPFAEL